MLKKIASSLVAASTFCAAGSFHTHAKQFQEEPVKFNEEHFGSLGPNARFLKPDAIKHFAGGACGGGGRFEDTAVRDIARATVPLANVLKKYNIGKGDTIVDVGAGTGLFLSIFSELVGETGNVKAIDIIPKFVYHMEMRVKREGIKNVDVTRCTPKSTRLEKNIADAAFICDVYHHFEPKKQSYTFLTIKYPPFSFEIDPGVKFDQKFDADKNVWLNDANLNSEQQPPRLNTSGANSVTQGR